MTPLGFELVYIIAGFMKDFNKRAREIIEKILYITIASVSKEGLPLNTPVFSAYDKDYNFYWGSRKDSHHSQNVRSTDYVALVIYDSTVEAGTGEGVYVRAKVKELTEPKEIAAAHKILQSRRDVPFWKEEQVQGDGPIRLYKAISEEVWMNGDGELRETYVDIRVPVDLLK